MNTKEAPKELSLTEFLGERNRIMQDVSYDADFNFYEMKVYGVDPDSIKIIYTDEAVKGFEEYARRPLFSVIGKPLDKEETVKILRVTDSRYTGEVWKSIYDGFYLGGAEEKPKAIEDAYYINCWFGDRRIGGWLHPNGMIYFLGYPSQKHPTLLEFMRFWVMLSTFTEKMDVVVAVTRYSETLERDEAFEHGIKGGLHIQGKTITVMEPPETARLYTEYRVKYGEPPVPMSYFNRQAQRELMERCDRQEDNNG